MRKMLLQLFTILLIHFFFCEAVPGTNEPYQYPNNANKAIDCLTTLPDQNRKQVPSSSPMNTDRLEANPQVKPVAYIPNSNLYTNGGGYGSDGKPNSQPLTLDPNFDDPRRNGNNQPLTDSTELGKLIEKCVSTKLKQAKLRKSQKQLDSEDFLNTRRNNNESKEDSDSVEVLGRRDENVKGGALADPAQGPGLKRLAGASGSVSASLSASGNILLMNNKRVCYACTSANSADCWVPNRSTTVKYCNRQNDACITKTYNAPNGLIVIRDCGNSCVDPTPGVHPEFKTCSICHKNLCNDSNGAFNIHINLYSIFLGLIFVTFVKRLV